MGPSPSPTPSPFPTPPDSSSPPTPSIKSATPPLLSSSLFLPTDPSPHSANAFNPALQPATTNRPSTPPCQRAAPTCNRTNKSAQAATRTYTTTTKGSTLRPTARTTSFRSCIVSSRTRGAARGRTG
ncbi:MAG: hypothetical protein L6R42_007396 [Xanthoria sp. 1 TBL-2021]|nr:MAG: hypothetical protein L6R42_007396 [Xanthoria sp. 1 TBL-2021]